MTPASHDYWFDERVQTYEKSFRLAKRITFLSVRAVEYELQQTLVDGRGGVAPGRHAGRGQRVRSARCPAGAVQLRGRPEHQRQPADREQGRGETSGYARAQIEAVFNVPREEFSSDDDANGATTQLGARGLYGEYALFTPAAIISQTVGATQTSGLDLSRIEDVLLRMDGVAVAR